MSLFPAYLPGPPIGIFWLITNSVPGWLLCKLMRNKAKNQRELYGFIRKFDIERDTKVTVEKDREIVYSEIKKQWSGTFRLFEEFVRVKFLNDFLIPTLGRNESDIPYSWGLFICQPFIWYASTDSFAISQEALTA